MGQEKIKVLEMLSEGKITADEALALLKQIPDDDDRQPRYPRGWDQWRHEWNHWKRDWAQWQHDWNQGQPPVDLNWINDLQSVIKETAMNAVFTDTSISGAKEERFSSQGVDNGIRALVFEGKNAPVKLEAYGGDRIEVDAYYKVKTNWNPRLALTEENGIFSLSYDDNALYMLGISIRVPEKARIGTVRLKNRNARITVDDIKAEKIEVSTQNESVKISDIEVERLYCETKNASIILDDIEAREVDAQTSNAKIKLDNVEAFRARMATSNAKIDVKDSDIVQLYAKTSNSPLKFDNLKYNKQEPVYSVDAITTNGNISIRLPCGEFKSKLRASTTAGSILSELDDLEYQVNERNYAEAMAYDYESAQNKLNLNLQTTHGGIYIKR